MTEFTEILHSGGKVELKKLENGEYSITYKYSKRTPMIYIPVCVSYDGKLIDTVSFTGLGTFPIYPKPSILAHLLSDQNGMFGKICSRCFSYFRTDYTGKRICCPYCGHCGHTLSFTTKNQQQFIASYCELHTKTINSGQNAVIDYDEITKNLPENEISPWVYKEEQQQTQSQCTSCKIVVDILGDYGICPNCGLHNAREIFNEKIDSFENRFLEAFENLADRHEREEEWEKLLRCVSEFESLANELNKFLLSYPMTPSRRKDLSQLSYQKILNADKCIFNWFGFNILGLISSDDRDFLNKMFNRRHLFTHKGGRVDQEYIENTNDSTVKINQTIRLRSNEIKRLIPLIRQAGNNFIVGFVSIK